MSSVSCIYGLGAPEEYASFVLFLENEIECPRHGARFNLKTGEATEGPALLPIDTFNIKISDNGDILIES